jgi:lipoprotein-anchoring transpeptidase ErfK/SrfK
MDDDELQRLLAGAFDAGARKAVGDDATPPPPRFAQPDAGQRAHAHKHVAIRFLAPLAAAAAVIAVVALVPTLTGGDHPAAPRSAPAVAAPTRTPPGTEPAAGKRVQVRLLNSDGSTYGVGMPVVAYFSKPITDGRALAAATSVTVNGKPMRGAWYFERSAAGHGPIEGHYRLSTYWPAHAKVHMSVAARGRSAGAGLTIADDLNLDFVTGARTVSTVDDAKHRLIVTRDGKPIGDYPVSLGGPQTPTSSGIKVIIAKGSSVCMSGPGYDECGIKYTQRLTYDGEYLHAAPWNTAHIGNFDSSNGCTNLTTAAALKLYNFLEVGDVVTYPNANGPKMQLGQGYGDWNVPWSQWVTGGAASTT